MSGALLPLEEAQRRLLELAPAMPSEVIPVGESVGRYLAEDVIAQRTQPSADLSAMDGYAIGADSGPWQLVGESKAGSPYSGIIQAGQCVRISTGAHMPQGSDRVLIQENASSDGARVTLSSQAPMQGQHVRKLGMDFATGERLITAGTRMTPAHIALAIGGGNATAKVSRAPKVAILDSGDELSADPTQCEPHQIPASNGAMLKAMLEPLGCDVISLGPVPDERDALADALANAENCDIVVTSGGASVGDHDLVKPALEAWGAQLAFWKVAMKPGKPLLVATRGNQVVLGLPGNPVSSLVTCFLFGLPLIRAAMGARQSVPETIQAPLGEPVKAGGSRKEYLRGVWDGTMVRLADHQDSSALAILASSNCLIEREINAPELAAGDTVEIHLLHHGG